MINKYLYDDKGNEILLAVTYTKEEADQNANEVANDFLESVVSQISINTNNNHYWLSETSTSVMGGGPGGTQTEKVYKDSKGNTFTILSNSSSSTITFSRSDYKDVTLWYI